MTIITRLQASNFKKLTAIDIQPGAGVVPIRGRNAQGKSSTLDAIAAALGGTDAMPPRPVRAGEEEGAIRLELDNGTVIMRRFTVDGKPSLEVTNSEGFKAGSPQKLLDTLYASVAFDPLAFTRLKPADQLATLRGLVKLDVDVPALEKRIKDAYDARRDKNRELERERTKLEQLPVHSDIPAEPVDEAALDAKIAGAAEANATLERRRANRADFAAAIERNKAALVRINEDIVAAEQHLADLRTGAADVTAQIEKDEATLANAEPLPEPVDISDLQEQQRATRATNAKIAANRARDVQQRLVLALAGESDALTETIDESRDAIAAAIERAEMPVPGLSFGDGEVLLNGLPIEQASSAEQLRLSTAIGIASSPKLRVMLVRDGSLLDEDGEKILADMAAEHGFQLWVEAVDTSGAVGIVIEDGAVVAIDGEPAPAPEEIAKPRRRAKKAEQEQVAEQAREVLTPSTVGPDVDTLAPTDASFEPQDDDSLPYEPSGIDDDEQDPPFDTDARAEEDEAADLAQVATRPATPSLFD